MTTFESAWYASHINHGVGHWVYVIHATPHMFVNDGIEDQVLAVGGIPSWLVIGWYWIGAVDRDLTPTQIRQRMQRNIFYRHLNTIATPDLPQPWDHSRSRESALAFLSRPASAIWSASQETCRCRSALIPRLRFKDSSSS